MLGSHLVKAHPQDDRHRQKTRKEGTPEREENGVDLFGQRLGKDGVGGKTHRREQHENRAKGIA